MSASCPPLSPLQPALRASTKPGPWTRPVPNVLRTAMRSGTGAPSATATLDSSALTPTLLPWPAPVRTHTHTHTMGPSISGGGMDHILCAAGKQKALSLSSPFCNLSKTGRVTNLSECHLFSAIPLFLTQPPSTSCLGVITEDVEK